MFSCNAPNTETAAAVNMELIFFPHQPSWSKSLNLLVLYPWIIFLSIPRLSLFISPKSKGLRTFSVSLVSMLPVLHTAPAAFSVKFKFLAFHPSLAVSISIPLYSSMPQGCHRLVHAACLYSLAHSV